MKSVIILKHVLVENANAGQEMVSGFPAITNFLGFDHALSLKLDSYAGLALGGCAVVCHGHHIQAYRQSTGDNVFSLTRNPLTKEASHPSFVEEARMHMDVSLIIECNFNHSQLDFDIECDTDEAQVEHLTDWIRRQVVLQRLAGGTITGIQDVEFYPVPSQEDELSRFTRRTMVRLLPGYFLVDRNELLRKHHEDRKLTDSNASLIDSWLDFVVTRSRSTKEESTAEDGEVQTDRITKVAWERLPKPASGWLVPIATGYTAISPLYDPGRVKRTRDVTTPFRFVESVYSIGQWISPHRINDIESVFWHYQQKGNSYLCVNNFVQQAQSSTEAAGSK